MMAKGNIITREVTYAGPACTLNAFVAEPADAESSPAAIVVQEWWGLNEHIRDVARRLAREGYFAIAPDLYSRQGHKIATEPNMAAQLMGGLKKEDGIADLQTTVQWLRAQAETRSSHIGITGFCMGGSYAMLLPCESKEIAAAAPFYGEIPPDEKLKQLGCPIFYAYGENDGWIQRADVDRLATALKKFDKRGEVKVYTGCSHGFFNDTRADVYRPDEAKDAWEQTLKLFAANLKG
jgi:carboxymethylenebutenolidase